MNDESSEQMSLIQQVSYPLYDCRGWMKFLGVMSIIGGVLQALTIFGIIVAWLPIWTGILLFQSATAVEEAHYTGSEYELIKSLAKLKTYFIIMGVLALLGIVFFVLFFFLGMAGMMFNFSRMIHQ